VIYLLRHGQTEFNTERRIQGRCDSPLTELGKAQARAMGETLSVLLDGLPRFELVSSPQPRALSSAELVAEAAGLDGRIVTDERLQEVGCGSWEKHRFATLAERDPLIGAAPNFLSAWAKYCRDGEGIEAASDRLASFLRWAEGKSLVVVSHGCAGSILRALYVGADRAAMLESHSAPQDRFHRLYEGAVEEIDAFGRAQLSTALRS
jgi:probable phosphoglycerate mutase